MTEENTEMSLKSSIFSKIDPNLVFRKRKHDSHEISKDNLLNDQLERQSKQILSFSSEKDPKIFNVIFQTTFPSKDVPIVDETDLVQYCLLALTGISSPIFVIDKSSFKCLLNKCRLETTSENSLMQIVSKFAQLATIHARILQFLEVSSQKRLNVIFQRFVASIREILESYYTQVVFLPVKIRSRSPHVTILSLWKELKSLHEILNPICQILEINPCDVYNCDEISIWKHHDSLMDHLYEILMMTLDPTVYSVLRASCTPYFERLSDFVTYGICDNVFFLQENIEKYEIVHLPIFLKDYNESIVKIGKYINIMKNYLKNQTRIEFSFPLFQEWEQDLFRSIENILNQRFDGINAKIVEYFQDVYQMTTLLTRIEEFYFLPPEPLLESFLNAKLFNEMNLKQIFTHLGLPVKIDFDPNKTKGTYAMELCRLTFEVDFPLNLVIKPEYIAQYQKIFHVLIKMKKIQQMIDSMWLSQRDLFQATRMIILNLSNHYLHQIKFKFTSSLHYLTREFHQDLKTIKSLDLISERYQIYLESINSLISPKSSEILSILYDLHVKTYKFTELTSIEEQLSKLIN